MIEINIPTFIILERKTKKDKKVYLNLNTYRNTKYIVLNQWKTVFSKMLKPELKKVAPALHKMRTDFPGSKYKLTYTITSKNLRKFDISNFLTVIDKFTCDVLVNEGYIPEEKVF